MRRLLGQVSLVAVGIGAFQAIGESTGTFASAGLIELSGAALGAALGFFFDQPVLFGVSGATSMVPLAGLAFIVLGGIGC
ncbi:MAG TPA: hypothetical protein VHC22_24805 [Pirellulales bacterium]|nr:hypothetical protein [Pirellulales bacterium]